MKKTRILFIKYHEAADQQPLSQKAAEKLGIFPSLALAQLAAWVRMHGYIVDIIDLHAENLLPKDAANRVADWKPDIVALTAKTLGWPAVIEIAQMVRQAVPKAVVVCGGPQMAIYPRESLTWDCFDLAVVGDGEDTFLDICDHVEQGSALNDIPGTLFRHPSGEIDQNPARAASRTASP